MPFFRSLGQLFAGLLYVLSTPLTAFLILYMIYSPSFTFIYSYGALVSVLPFIIAILVLIVQCIRKWKHSLSFFLPFPLFLCSSALYTASFALGLYGIIKLASPVIFIFLFSVYLFFSPFISLCCLRRKLSFSRVVIGLLSVMSTFLFSTASLDFNSSFPFTSFDFSVYTSRYLAVSAVILSSFLFSLTSTLTRRFCLSFGEDGYNYRSKMELNSPVFCFPTASSIQTALVDQSFSSQFKDFQLVLSGVSFKISFFISIFGQYFLMFPAFLILSYLTKELPDFMDYLKSLDFTQILSSTVEPNSTIKYLIVSMSLPIISLFVAYVSMTFTSDRVYGLMHSLQFLIIVIFTQFDTQSNSLSLVAFLCILTTLLSIFLSSHYSQFRWSRKENDALFTIVTEEGDIDSSTIKKLLAIRLNCGEDVFMNTLCYVAAKGKSQWNRKPIVFLSGVRFIRERYRNAIFKKLEETKTNELEQLSRVESGDFVAPVDMPDEPNSESENELPGAVPSSAKVVGKSNDSTVRSSSQASSVHVSLESPIFEPVPRHPIKSGRDLPSIVPLRQEEEVGEPISFHDQSDIRKL
ncbi:hypothetical protein RCL1_006534 [Eukaryota sp. TZLM3-RCL]